MQPTSLAALQHMDDTGKRQTHAELILQALKAGAANYEAIAMRCGYSPYKWNAG